MVFFFTKMKVNVECDGKLSIIFSDKHRTEFCVKILSTYRTVRGFGSLLNVDYNKRLFVIRSIIIFTIFIVIIFFNVAY